MQYRKFSQRHDFFGVKKLATIQMLFHVTKTEDELYHIQNSVMGLSGQHHVHTQKGFDSWLKGVKKGPTVEHGKCSCGLKAGYVRDHDGQVWKNDKFE